MGRRRRPTYSPEFKGEAIRLMRLASQLDEFGSFVGRQRRLGGRPCRSHPRLQRRDCDAEVGRGNCYDNAVVESFFRAPIQG